MMTDCLVSRCLLCVVSVTLWWSAGGAAFRSTETDLSPEDSNEAVLNLLERLRQQHLARQQVGIFNFLHVYIWFPSLGYERLYLPLRKVADIPFRIQGVYLSDYYKIKFIPSNHIFVITYDNCCTDPDFSITSVSVLCHNLTRPYWI